MKSACENVHIHLSSCFGSHGSDPGFPATCGQAADFRWQGWQREMMRRKNLQSLQLPAQVDVAGIEQMAQFEEHCWQVEGEKMLLQKQGTKVQEVTAGTREGPPSSLPQRPMWGRKSEWRLWTLRKAHGHQDHMQDSIGTCNLPATIVPDV